MKPDPAGTSLIATAQRAELLSQPLSETPDLQCLNPEAPIAITRRNLPHWEQAGCTYFITYRMADSLPAEKLRQLERERDLFCKQNPKPWDEATWRIYTQQFEGGVQQWLDAGHGSCVLEQSALRDIVAEGLHHFDGQRYQLGDYVIMPNHVHLLFTPAPGFEMKSLLHTWKSFSAKAMGKACAEAPTHFWQHETYDHIVRSPQQLAHYQNYIRENPAKAHLKPGTWTHWEKKVEQPAGLLKREPAACS